jgi:hypothetical protein
MPVTPLNTRLGKKLASEIEGQIPETSTYILNIVHEDGRIQTISNVPPHACAQLLTAIVDSWSPVAVDNVRTH